MDPLNQSDDLNMVVMEEPVHEEEIYEEYIEEVLDMKDDPDSSAEMRRKRSKIPDPAKWAKNVRKKLRISGQEYISSRGKLMSGRKVQPKDCSACKKNCNVSFSEKERQKIHETYWRLPSDLTKRYFISSLVEEVPVRSVRTKAEKSRRSATRLYHLRLGRKKVPVCKGFFLATLDISESVVGNILKHRDQTTNFPRESQQGRHRSARARPEDAKAAIREHIASFILPPDFDPSIGVVPARKKDERRPLNKDDCQYVEPGQNIKRMWEDYKQQCEWNYIEPEKEWIYRQILKEEFNIIFLDPIKKEPTSAEYIAMEEEDIEEEEEEPVERKEFKTEVSNYH